ncbi:hypothetical protein UNDYM_3200 [Undibacterium sp. YM2]|uniref:c-type cytochrome n=1 Tax=Undibacterium sp. YM2 TaxID=2058625 RepID=UPI001331CBBA|nr:hypothetical protein UNDYM_3200 [Undibacterium sp. YM2]
MHFTYHLKASLLCFLLGLPLIATAQAAQPAQSSLKVPDTLEQRLKACTACHGAEGRAGTDGFYPRIAGKPAGYLYNQLLNFREGKRAYPAMRYMVAHMSDAYLKEIAEYFASQHPPYAAPRPVMRMLFCWSGAGYWSRRETSHVMCLPVSLATARA